MAFRSTRSHHNISHSAAAASSSSPIPEMPPAPSSYDSKYKKPSSHLRGPGGKSNRILHLLLLLLALGNVGLVYYFRNVREAETGEALAALQRELDEAQGSMRRELSSQSGRLEEAEGTLARTEKALQHAQAALKERESQLQRKEEEHARALHEAEERAEKANAKVAKLAESVNQDAVIQAVQKQARIFNRLRWGEGPARVVLEMAPLPNAPADKQGQVQVIELETAPFDMMPHAVHYFLTLIETGYWDGCHIIRNAHHVIQLNCSGRKQRPELRGVHPSVAFQEYSPDFAHEAWTAGIAGRPGGPDWYFNLMDNKRSHGPGGQGPEADPCFAKVVRGREAIEDYHHGLGNEFLAQEAFVEIKRAYIAPPQEQQPQQQQQQQEQQQTAQQ